MKLAENFENKGKRQRGRLVCIAERNNNETPILNNIIIKDKVQLNNHIGLVVKSKVGEYRFLKEKLRQC